MDEIKKRLREIKKHLANLVDYAISSLETIITKYQDQHPRKTEIISFDKVDVREAAQRNLKLKYDKTTGYLGYGVNGNVLFDVSPYDRILVIRKTGVYSVMDVPERFFVDKGMWYCGFMNEKTTANTIFSLVFRNNTTGFPFIKRCKIEKFILNKGYSLVPERCSVMKLTTGTDCVVSVDYKPKPRLKVLHETFVVEDYLIKGVKAGGVRLANKEVKSVRFERNTRENLLL
jgi:topoisomerase-4 subunit A